MSKQGRIRVCKRNKELFKGFPYYVAVDLPKKGCAWYLRADGTLSPDCCDDTDKQVPNSGWFADMEEVMDAIALHENTPATPCSLLYLSTATSERGCWFLGLYYAIRKKSDSWASWLLCLARRIYLETANWEVGAIKG